MTLLLHIIIAFASLASTSIAVLYPSQSKLRVSYGLALLTLASGGLLLITASTHMREACTMGLCYLALTAVGITIAFRKVAAERYPHHS